MARGNDVTRDDDLPGDETFRPTRSGDAIISISGGPAWAMMDAVSAEEQAAMHHNRLRYHELWRARHAMPNSYGTTKYR